MLGLSSSRLGPKVPDVPAACRVWQLPHVPANCSRGVLLPPPPEPPQPASTIGRRTTRKGRRIATSIGWRDARSGGAPPVRRGSRLRPPDPARQRRADRRGGLRTGRVHALLGGAVAERAGARRARRAGAA